MPEDKRMNRAEGGRGGAIETHQYMYEGEMDEKISL